MLAGRGNGRVLGRRRFPSVGSFEVGTSSPDAGLEERIDPLPVEMDQDLFDEHPGSEVADHALGNVALRRALREIFRTRTTAAWVEFGVEVNTPIVPVNSAESIVDDPQFQERMGFFPAAEHGTDLMPSPIKLASGALPTPARAPTVGQHAHEILREVLGYDRARLDALDASGALG